ncbi:hypothetical protein BEWA_001880 [Theileria equi strain WA]|uniref:Signal peptide containing protein n=1 Tax=Theileria equi strain WA TaxID=1537102 RepID=L0B0J2_THEEQ|nr:hypothetical protein BEWA_001880 [Theileria equi strain WA]AFZ80781.1 hypothetical protein BEWA_001880 [Theileria equi strain WA]|eukprot:XP_004830447.1 hypothetical protein BEWA_001880 [Theileria equi strain WA]
MKFPYVFSLTLLVRLSSCDDAVFDLSSPDPSFVRDYESTVDGVVYQSFFSNGLFFNKVVDGGVTLWEAEGEEKCSVLFTSVGDRTRVILHVWVKGIPSRMMHYEKLDGEWKLSTVRVKGRPVSDKQESPQESLADLDFASLGCPLGGSLDAEAKPKVTLPPAESEKDGEELSDLEEHILETKVEEHKTPEEDKSEKGDKVEASQDVSTPVSLDFSNLDETKIYVDKQNLVGVLLKGYFGKDGYHIDSVVDGDEELWKATEGASQKCKLVEYYAKNNVELLYLETSDSSDTKYKYLEKVSGTWSEMGKEPFIEKLYAMKSDYSEPTESDNVVTGNIISAESKEVTEEKAKDSPVEDFKLVIEKVSEDSKSDSNKVKVNEPAPTPTKEPKKNLKGTSPKDATEQAPVQAEAKNHPIAQQPAYTLAQPPQVNADKQGDTPAAKGQGLPPANPVQDTPEPAAVQQGQAIKPGDAPDIQSNTQTVQSKEGQPPIKPVPVPDYKSKVDGSLFDVEEAEEEHVKILTLTAKEGVKAKSLTFGSDTIWPGKSDVTCSSAVLYMDGEKPILAALVTRDKNNKQGTVYRYHDGEKWVDVNVDDHNKNLTGLKKKCHPVTLDISKKDNSVGTYINTTIDKTHVHNFDLKSATVIKVVDGGVTLWEAPEGSGYKCLYADNVIVTDKETLKLTIKMDKREVMNFKKEGGQWKKVDPETNSQKSNSNGCSLSCFSLYF